MAEPAVDSWKGRAVADEMLAAAEEKLDCPSSEVYPFWLLVEAVRSLDRLPSPARFLELGCGVGHNGELLEREFPGWFEYIGSDYSPDMVDVARDRWPARRFFVADVLDPNLDLSGFDVVCAAGLIEVIQPWRAALAAVLSAPARHVILHRQRMAKGWRTRVEEERHYAGRMTWCVYLSQRDLRRTASRHGRRVSAHVWREGEAHHTFVLPR